MSAKYVQEGKQINYTNPSAVAAIEYGDVVDLDTMVGIAAATIAASETGALAIEGVYEFPAIATAEFTVGMDVYWDPVAGKVTNDGVDLTPVGKVVAPKIAAGTTARVKINV